MLQSAQWKGLCQQMISLHVQFHIGCQVASVLAEGMQ